MLDQLREFLRAPAAVSFAVALFMSPPAFAQTIDPNIQSRVDQYVDRPTGQDLIVKRPVAGAKAHKTGTKTAPRPHNRMKRE